MNIGRLLASRNAKTVRFNSARAGSVDMPASELVNGALAACPHELGAKILECVHSPECGNPAWVECEVLSLLVRERGRRAERIQNAELAWHLASLGKSSRYSEHQAFQRLEEAKGARWPNWERDRYAAIAEGVFHELLRKHLCPDCGGRGQVTQGTLVKICSTCNGTGRAQQSNNARAALCAMHHVAFANYWVPVYSWLLCRLHSEIKVAEDFIYDYCHAEAA